MDGTIAISDAEPQLLGEKAPRGARRLSLMLLGFSVAVIAAVAIALMGYAVPVDSDWSRITRLGNTPHDMGWWKFVFGFTYMRWQGRWASCGIEALILPHIDPIAHYRYLLAAVAVVNAVGIYVVCRWITRRGPRRIAVAMAIAGLALLWAGLPSIAEGVYWFTGALENSMVLSLAAMLLVAAVSLPLEYSSVAKRNLVLAALALAMFVVCGFHELYATMIWLIVLTGLLTSLWSRHGTVRTWAVLWAIATIGLFIVVLAPGNARRMHSDGGPHSHQLFYDIRLTLSRLWDDGREWFFDPKLIAASLWVAFSPTLEAARSPWPSARRVGWRWILPPLWIAMLGVGFFFPCWAFGNGVPPRTLSGDYIIFVAGWLLIVYAWTRPLHLPTTSSPEQSPRRSFHRTTAVAAISLLAVALLCTGNLPVAVKDLIIRIRPWHQAVEQRYTTLRHSAGAEAVTLPRLPPQPWTLHAGEISDDPHDWHNQNIAAFYQIKTLNLQPQAAPALP